MIGKKDETVRGGKLLSLKKQRGLQRQQEERGHGSVHPRMAQPMKAAAVAEIGDLIVVFNVINESGRWYPQYGGAASLVLPAIILPLIEKTPFRGGEKFLCLS